MGFFSSDPFHYRMFTRVSKGYPRWYESKIVTMAGLLSIVIRQNFLVLPILRPARFFKKFHCSLVVSAECDFLRMQCGKKKYPADTILILFESSVCYSFQSHRNQSCEVEHSYRVQFESAARKAPEKLLTGFLLLKLSLVMWQSLLNF